MKMRPETRAAYIRQMKMSIMAIEAVIADLKKESDNDMANIRFFKEIKGICEKQLDMTRMEGRKNY